MTLNASAVSPIYEEPIPLITSRLDLIVGTKKRHISGAGGKAPNGERKNTGKTVAFKFNEFPLDLVLEVISYLDPEDLLKLCRLSKGSRALFLSKNCTAVWCDVLAGVADLPKCPQDLTEPQYASLIFDKFCMGCGSTRGNIETQYLLRLRLCQGCSNKNVVTGYSLKSRLGQSACDVLTLLPSTGPGLIWFYPKVSVLSSLENELNMSYFLPEAEKMIVELEARKEQKGSPEYQKFISDQQAVATRMMNEGLAIRMGADSLAQKKEETEAAVRRRKTMLAEMKALGWETKYFPTDPKHLNTKKWNEFLDRKHDLTEREWELIRPIMQLTYETHRDQVLMEALVKQLDKTYPSLRKKQSALVRVGLAPWLDLLTLPSVVDFVASNHRRKCNDDDMNQFLQVAHANAFDFLTGTAESLTKIVDEGLDKEGSTVETVKQASTLFICSCDKCEEDKVNNKELFSYPNIVLHWADANPGSSWFACSRFDISLDPQAVKVAEDVLVALELPKNTQRAAILKMRGFVCRCGHPHYGGSLSFETLVYHIHSEQVTCSKIKSLLYPKSDPETQALIQERHSPERLRELVAVAGPSDEARSKRKRKSQLNYHKICRQCYQLTLMCHITDVGLDAYHMKIVHGRKLVKGDMLSIEELTKLYGSRPEGTFVDPPSKS